MGLTSVLPVFSRQMDAAMGRVIFPCPPCSRSGVVPPAVHKIGDSDLIFLLVRIESQ
jgi:hypothetical protein